MSFLEYIGKKLPNIAALMALLLHPKEWIKPSFLEFARRVTAKGSLHNWVELRISMFHLTALAYCFISDDKEGVSIISKLSSYELKEDVRIPAEGSTVLQLLSKTDSASMSQFYQKIVERLANRGCLLTALSVADEVLPMGTPDWLLLRIIASTTDKKEAWRYIERLGDPSKAAPLIIKWLDLWDIDVCL